MEKEYKPFYVSDVKFTREYSYTDRSIDAIYDEIVSNLDYDIEFAEDRVRLVRELFENNPWVVSLISTEKVINSHVKNKSDFLSETTQYGKIMDITSAYITHPKFRNADEKKLHDEEKEQKELFDKILTKARKEKIKAREKVQSDDTIEKIIDSKKEVKVETNYKITNEDINTFPEIKAYQDTINKIGVILGYKINMSKTVRMHFYANLELSIGKKGIRLYQNFYREMHDDIILAKKMLRGVFYFNSFTSSHKNINLKNFYFTNKEHVKLLIENYPEYYDNYREDFNSDMWATLWTLKDLIKKSSLTEDERLVWQLHTSNYSRNEIKEYLERLNSKEYNIKWVERVLTSYLPSKVVSQHLQDVDDWIYTYKLKGQFKKCSKCGEIKVISNDRYFNKEPKGKDGYKNICKECTK